MVADLQSLRLGLKRTFIDYYLALRSPGIADPTESFAACHDYLFALRDRLGPDEFMFRLDDETTDMVGHVEQDLRQKSRRKAVPALVSDPALSDDIEDRLRECFEHALGRIQEEDPEGGADDGRCSRARRSQESVGRSGDRPLLEAASLPLCPRWQPAVFSPTAL